MRRYITIMLMILLSTIVAQGQIKIGGNVYGGGNKGDVKGDATVRVRAGEMSKVFGGARTANVGGRTFVNIDGEHALDDVVISEVYGGNDVAGTIGQSGAETMVPEELQNVRATKTDEELAALGITREKYNKTTNVIDNTWKTFVATSRSSKVVDANTVEDKWITIGTVFGGGNGDFIYTDEDGNLLQDESGNYIVTEKKMIDDKLTTITVATSPSPFVLPHLDKTYLEIKGGNIAHVYGGGNNATVRLNTTINIDNTSDNCQKFVEAYVAKNIAPGQTVEEASAQTIAWLKEMSGLRTFQSNITSFEFNHARIFGGNNKSAMAIRPTWNLQQGIIRDIYSGGNRGDMNSSEGLLLEIDPVEKDHLAIHNIFGGCRMADVKPLDGEGKYRACLNLQDKDNEGKLIYHFPPGLSARVLVRGGIIDNVYGGNDITGTVYGGNAVGIYSTINGDVYGGGNGAYAYTSKVGLKDDADYGDFYFDAEDFSSQALALNAHRPNAEQVSIRLAGTDAANPTIIKGSVFVGGNCASLATKNDDPKVELKIGSHVIADKVFLGNNGEKMVDTEILKLFNNKDFGSMDLTKGVIFSDYMLGAAMDLQPSVVFDSEDAGDPKNYEPYSSYVGSFYCGGNRGSMIIPGKNTYEIDQGLYIFDKFVGGCNNAYVDEQWTGEEESRTQLCTAYEGGVLGSADEKDNFTDASGNIKDRLEINLQNLTILPKRWTDDSKTELEWNTEKWNDATGDFVQVARNPSDNDIRLAGGNVYGGCYESGHVNGNVVININDDLMKKEEVFIDEVKDEGLAASTSGVKLENQRTDLMAVAMSVFGAGYGKDTEIWGSTTVNLNKGYVFQIFGGGELGVVGRKRDVLDEESGVVTGQEYYFDPAFSSTVNLKGTTAVYSHDAEIDDLAETEYIYGGGNEGDVSGNTYVNLGKGRIYDVFGGASDANILGHTEVYIGRQPNGSGAYIDGFPWIKDIVYGGNDFGGRIEGGYENGYDFEARVKDYDATKAALLHGTPSNSSPGVLKSSSYVEYLQGRVDSIFGGGYGNYDYTLKMYEDDKGNKAKMPYQASSFVNIRPHLNDRNHILGIFGGSTGYPRNREGDNSQDRSYVLIDIPKNAGKDVEYYKNVEVFGAGSYNGLGMRFDKAATYEDSFDPDQLSAIVDLLQGKIKAVYGGSYNEGITARTVINVPATSTIHIDSIFGGAYGTQILPPCDVYESNVNYRSGDATVTGSIYGGNNNERRTLYAKVNVSAPVWKNKDKDSLAIVYGAGHGIDTWSEYTEVNLVDSARVEEVYGGGELGHVLNAESVQRYMQLYKDGPSTQIGEQDPYWKVHKDDLSAGGDTQTAAENRWKKDWKDAWTFGDYYVPNSTYTDYADNPRTNLTNEALVTHDADMDDRDFSAYSKEEREKRQYRYNTNVRIHKGATVKGYAYGGGLGNSKVGLTGDVYGTTYIGLLGGTVVKDIYAAGTTGAVYDLFGVGAYDASTNTNGFTASANAYIKGGSVRNVYGGGWKGNVGHHTGTISIPVTGLKPDDPSDDDIPGETHVVIGDVNGTSFTEGIPTVQRNAYGGGEGGAVFGTAHLTMYNGYIGYEYNTETKTYEEKIEDDTQTTPNTLLTDAGCMFGGGYIDNSSVDKTRVSLYNGHVRGSIFGGGEIAAIGRGSISKSTGGGKTTYSLEGIYRPGKTNIEMYGGQVHRNVYGGGRGVDNLGHHGSLNCDGYVFGQTEVRIHGGVVGTVSGVADGNGNVFGGGDEGFVYSALEEINEETGKPDFYLGVPSGERYKDDDNGYYYKHTWAKTGEGSGFIKKDGKKILTEDCKVLIEPHLRVTSPITIAGHSYVAGQYVPIDTLNTLNNKHADSLRWVCLDQTGIIIHNAVFAGGNIPSGSVTTSANTATVFGNATASINDIYHRDMITLGTRHTGGLYGDGNLTLVDGYRELNITNYGTDYYSIAKQIGIDAYHELPDREADYYELRYTCLEDCQDKDGTQYKKATKDASGFTTKASTITADEMQNLFVTTNTSHEKVSVQYGGKDVLKYDSIKGEWVPNTEKVDGKEKPIFWEESGVLPVYAGRLMNSIQRADFCGVFGSRMVMQGAQDRVPEEVDYTNYTINRVREVSLNKKNSVITGDVMPFHGNYFGIYNIVNYLGALTSDVDFGDDSNRPYARTTDNATDSVKYLCDANGQKYGTASFYDWKKQFYNDRRRNNGKSHNKVALASGVYLEITTEESTGNGLYEKVWGPITGVVELDLINVSPGIGGGFVYAKNQHGVRSKLAVKNLTTLTALNNNAVTKGDFEYTIADDTKKEWETSGNFVHSTQTIIDDCYNVSNKYKGDDAMPAHYWYIKGSTYVYDQYISAYTGSSNAFSETVDIPLTIAAASHGRMKLLNVQPNLYAYYSNYNESTGTGTKLGDGKKMVINDKTYYKNDPISYWDWYLLSSSEKKLFVEETYVNCITCTIDGVKYEAGTYVMTDEEFASYKITPPAGKDKHEYTDDEGKVIQTAEKKDADDDYIFRPSNIVGHESGYILTYEVNNPSKWDNWYTLKTGDYKVKKTLKEYEELVQLDASAKDNYYDGPTYRLKDDITGGILLGQNSYKEGDLITKNVEDTYQGIKNNPSTASAIPNPSVDDADYEKRKQAEFKLAYIVTKKITVPEGTSERHYNVGTTVPKTFADEHSGYVEEAYICTNSIQVTKEEVIYKDTKMTKTEADGYVNDVKSKMGDTYKDKTIDEIKALTVSGDLTAEKKKELIELATLRDELKASLVPAYYCTTAGLYGGNYYQSGKNYRGLEAWSSLTQADRDNFVFNYDALDLLIDPAYGNLEGQKYQYDGNYNSEVAVNNLLTGNPAGYSVTQSVDYTATYNSGSALDLGSGNTITVTRNGTLTSTSVITKGDELTRDVFEGLANEQRHYSSIAVKEVTGDSVTYYVVNTSFQIGSTPYAVGETISEETYSSLPSDEQACVTRLKFGESQGNKTYYYCRESYKKGGNITPIPSSGEGSVGGVGGGISDGGDVLLGTLITKSEYDLLPNQQRNFTIHGISPTETSTLFVSRESNIYDLSKEKIITVVYKYDYDETDGNGNVTPISERHVVNIHLTFKSGIPTVADITKPDIVLPGDIVLLRDPAVTPGAYEVTGGGWELFETERDAESHSNGIEYDPNNDKLYWYQDGYYVSYYAKSYSGRTYSNFVPVSVANYHDLAEVMADKDHHMYIDNSHVWRDPKIYINDYSESSENGLDLFKNLYDLSLITDSGNGYTVADGKITAAGESANSNLVGHALLSNRTRAERNLEFFLRTDIEHTGSWTPIGYDGVCDDPSTKDVDEAVKNSGKCFDGVLHGDGHTLKGLDHSLFNYLCGEVYNLGVMGSFNGAGIAENGGGYVESCWVNTTGTPDGSVRAVFGNPSADAGYKQIVNSYCQTGKTYQTTDTGNHGLATPMSEKEFYNGTVAYDLNNFYLYKRYNDQKVNSGVEYKYYTLDESGNILNPETPMTAYYANNAGLCSSGYNGIKYVEDRFKDGDFRYDAGDHGAIPRDENERYWQETVSGSGETAVKEDRWSPIWPDDYIFFGQKLTYGYDTKPHQEVPTAVVRDGGRLSDGDNANRVYRAPAYYRSKQMGVAHFNPKAYLAQKSSDGTKDAYPYMTAIDFAGHEQGHEKSAYKLGMQDGLFYAPVLDDDGLTGIENCDETKNLLVYAPATSDDGYVNAQTHGVLTDYFVDPEYSSYYDEAGGYKLVGDCQQSVHGHLVQNNLEAINDHLLVDKEIFNAPLAYSFDNDHRIWYQRKPADKEFVDRNKGWMGISIPFTAELVTTNDKGEITHFYSGSETSKNGTGSKIGHEYWLREFKSIGIAAKEGEPEKEVGKAIFNYPTAGGATSTNKTVTNHFLWDYYYEKTERKDKNSDIYQEYYRNDRNYASYPLLAATKPYIIGFPGGTYYEFDLSGSFAAQHTAAAIGKLSKQTITFASHEGTDIAVSDDENSDVEYETVGTGKKYTFTFHRNYLDMPLEASDYVMKDDGSQFDKVVGDVKAVPFRPYFTATSVANARRMLPEYILFGGDYNGLEEEPISTLGGLEIYVKDHRIIATSHLKEPVNICIMNVGGITLANYVLQPGETQETRVQNTGVYIVNKKKLFVK